MKKLVLAAIGLVAVVAGFGALHAPTASANPSTVYVINDHVGAALTGETVAAFDANIITPAGRTTIAGLATFAAIQTASGGQVTAPSGGPGGDTWILVKTDGTTAGLTLNGKGLTCAPLCDNILAGVVGTDSFATWQVTALGTHAVGDTVVATATQNSVPVDSGSLVVVGPAHDVTLAVTDSKTTIQEKFTAGTCTPTAATTSPSIAGVTATYTDINGKALVGYSPIFASSSSTVLKVGDSTGAGVSTTTAATTPVTMVQSDGTTVTAAETVCGVAAGSANVTATTAAGEISGVTGTVTRTAAITVTGVPAAIALTASPAAIACDGTATSTVTAKITDAAGNNVADNTPVTFSVVALGTANPITTKTTAGSASSTITPLSASAAGVTVIVSSGGGTVQASILVSCNLAAPTAPAGAAPTATTPAGNIAGPNTGTGGYLGQDGSDGFPMWAILALAAGSLVLLGGGLVARRSGK